MEWENNTYYHRNQLFWERDFKLLQEKDIKTVNTITKSFLEVQKMQIPLIQYCIMKKAIECFKYLLVNGYDDPNKTIEEQKSEYKSIFFLFNANDIIYLKILFFIKIIYNK